MAEENVTPAQLLEDAAQVRDFADSLAVKHGEADALPFRRAAAALERWAEALERGERVCRWFVSHPAELDCAPVWCGECGDGWRFPVGGPDENGVTFCPHCGGRVVVDDEEASDE